MEHEFWVAEAKNGSVMFDSQPGTAADVLNCCGDLEGKITIYLVTATETDRTEVFTVEQE